MSSELYLSRGALLFGGMDPPPDKVDAIVIGIPYDMTTTYRPGSRFAPTAIRRASQEIEFYSIRSDVDVEEYGIMDLGDIAIVQNPQAMIERISVVVGDLVSRYQGRLHVYLGGEHTVTVGIVKGVFREFPSLCTLIFDAHLDLRNIYLDEKINHSTTTRRLIEIVGPEKVYLVGVRAFTREEQEYAKQNKIHFTDIRSIRLLGLSEVTRRVSKWYSTNKCKYLHVSIDLDVLDPAYAPGVSTPEPDGLEIWALLEMIHAILLNRLIEFFSIDIVELTPPYDCSGITSTAAAKIAVEAIAAYISKTKEQTR